MIQNQVINYLLSSGDTYFILLNNLTKEFFEPNYVNEFNFIKAHLDKYGNIPDKETFLATFKDFDLIEVKERPSYLIQELFKDYKNRTIATTFNKVKKLCIEGKTDEALQLYRKTNDLLAKTGVAVQSVDILQDTSRYEAYVDKTTSYSRHFISTGFPELDEIINGWDREEENAVIIGRTGQGKTWLALKFAEAAVAQGLRVGFYSGEMSVNKVATRFDTLSGHIPNGAIIHGNENVKDEYSNFITSLPTKYPGSCFKVLTPDRIGGAANPAALRAFIEREQLDILFIDQYSLLEDNNKAKSRVDATGNIAVDIKNLQVMCHIPIIAISQMNRTKSEDGTDSSQIAQNDLVGQNATIVLAVVRNKKDKEQYDIELVKVRDGGTGIVLHYKVDLNRGIFTYIPSENDGLNKEEQLKTRYDTPNTPSDDF